MPMKKTKKKKKMIVAGAAAVILAAGAGVHDQFELVDLLQDLDGDSPTTIHEHAPSAYNNVLAELGSSERLSLADAIRGWFIRLPVAVKAVLLLPLWALGALPAALLPVLAPVWDLLSGLGLQLAVLAGVFCLVYKLLFPHKRVRDLFRKKNLKWLFLGAVTVTATDVVLAQLWTGWPVVRVLMLLAVGGGVLGLLWKRLCGRFKAPEPDVVTTRLVMELSA